MVGVPMFSGFISKLLFSPGGGAERRENAAYSYCAGVSVPY